MAMLYTDSHQHNVAISSNCILIYVTFTLKMAQMPQRQHDGAVVNPKIAGIRSNPPQIQPAGLMVIENG